QDVRARQDGAAADAECIGELDEVRARQWRWGRAPPVEKPPPLPHPPEVAVFDDRDLDGDAFLDRRRELAHRHLEAAVADDRPDFRLGPGPLRADRSEER